MSKKEINPKLRKMKSKILYIAIVGLTILSLTRCKVGPDFEDPEFEVPAMWTSTDTTVTVDSAFVPMEWWTFFQDDVLDSLIRAGLENNRDAKIAAERVERARLVLGVQKAELWPKFNYFAQGQRGNFANGLVLSQEQTNIAAGISTNWEIDFWGKYRRLNESAKADWMAQMHTQRSIQMSLINDIATTYFQLLEYRQRLEIAKTTTQLRDSTLAIIQDRFDAGLVPEIDLNQAQIQYATSAASIPVFERLSAQTEQLLCVLVGFPPMHIPSGTALNDQNYNPDIQLSVPSTWLLNRPDILIAYEKLKSANAIIGARTAALYPSISISGTLATAGTPESFGGAAAWNAGAGLMGPLFYWRQNLRNIDIAETDTRIALLGYEQAVLNGVREVESSLVEINTLKEEIVARQLHVESALNAQNLSQMRYDQGVTSYLEFLESQRQYFEAQNLLATSQAQLLAAYTNLYRASGGGWLNENERDNAQNGQ